MEHEMRKEINKFKVFLKENSEEKLNISDVMFSFEEMIFFSKWCLKNKRYKYDDNGEFWFDSETLKKLSWEEIWEIYNQKLKHQPQK
jgi:hypothetical protein